MLQIDAIEILKDIQGNLEETRIIERCAIDMAIEALKERPHGEWIDRSDGGRIRYPFWERYECSKCGAKSENTNFCPNCGADMRKEGEAE